MNVEIISRKLLIISAFSAVVILISIYVYSISNRDIRLSMCNSGSKINLLIQAKNFDILIHPVGRKEVLDCLGKYMPYYDRTIEVVVSSDKLLLEELKSRYRVQQIIVSDNFTFRDASVKIGTGITVLNNKQAVLVYQRPIMNIDSSMKYLNNYILVNPTTDNEFELNLGEKLKQQINLNDDEEIQLLLGRL